jgi:hypothetical protein
MRIWGEAARLFLELQEQRHAADYDHGASVDKASLLSACQDVEVARAGFAVPRPRHGKRSGRCSWYSGRICEGADVLASGDGQGTGASARDRPGGHGTLNRVFPAQGDVLG